MKYMSGGTSQKMVIWKIKDGFTIHLAQYTVRLGRGRIWLKTVISETKPHACTMFVTSQAGTGEYGSTE
jgi:hypothetical protein